MTKEGLHDLLEVMSLEEKVGQMNQLSGSFFNPSASVTGPIEGKKFARESISLCGSVLGLMGTKTVKKVQKEYLENHPHKIPLLFMMDVINGYKTIFPIPLAQGASFAPELAGHCAKIAAKEAAADGLHVTFSPMTDLVWDARWGRVMESTGEDPYLNGRFAEAMVKGYQGNGFDRPYTMAACVKHFAGYGAPEAGRDYNTVELSQHTLRQFYLPAYEAGIHAGAALTMASFNTLEGIPATGNLWLMREVLRKEIGFEGVLISDWSAIEEMISHGYCADRKEAALRAVMAGVDIDMMSGVYAEHLVRLVREGQVAETLIDEAVMRILELKNNLGLFENPYPDSDENEASRLFLCQEHREFARKAARESFVLLKNDGILPLAGEKKTAFIGPYVGSQNLIGSWSLTGDVKDVTTLKKALLEQGPNQDMAFAQGSPMLDEMMDLEGFHERQKENFTPGEQEKMLKEAIDAAKRAEVVVMALGEDRLQSGEATSNANIQIPKVQQVLLEEVSKANENVIVVLFSGRPLDIRNIVQKAKAILQVWLPGTEGARAIVDVLFGEYNPSGKLPMAFPYCVGQVPIHYNSYPTGRPHIPGKDKDRFRSKYLDIPNEPLFPFGYGLSYTCFSISPVMLSKKDMIKGGCIEASVMVKNIGSVKGTETLQLYIHDLAASVVRPVKELKGFCKVELKPGEARKVCFSITEKELRFLTGNGRVESEEGEFEVYIGNSSSTDNKARFMLGCRR